MDKFILLGERGAGKTAFLDNFFSSVNDTRAGQRFDEILVAFALPCQRREVSVLRHELTFQGGFWTRQAFRGRFVVLAVDQSAATLSLEYIQRALDYAQGFHVRAPVSLLLTHADAPARCPDELERIRAFCEAAAIRCEPVDCTRRFAAQVALENLLEHCLAKSQRGAPCLLRQEQLYGAE